MFKGSQSFSLQNRLRNIKWENNKNSSAAKFEKSINRKRDVIFHDSYVHWGDSWVNFLPYCCRNVRHY